MSMWKRTMDYLGLGPDDAYDDYDIDDDYEPAAPCTTSARPRARARRRGGRDDTARGGCRAHGAEPTDVPVA